MAEFLITVFDQVSPADLYKDVKCTKRGDVLTILPDGWIWSLAELSNPQWRIIKWPGVAVSNALDMVQQEADTRTVQVTTDPMLQARGFKLNLSDPRIPAGVVTFIADNTRAVPFYTIPPQLQFPHTLLKVQKAKRVDPTVIG